MLKKFFIALISILIVYFIVSLSGLLNITNLKLYDYITHAKFSEKPTLNRTLIVTIDDKSISKLGQWPWPRLVMAKLIENISNYNPASIGVDIIFSEKDRSSPKSFLDFYNNTLSMNVKLQNIPKDMQDNDLILATRAKDAVFPIIIQQNPSKCTPNNFIQGSGPNVENAENFLCNIDKIQKMAKRTGFINSHMDFDGLIRKYRLVYGYKNRLVPSLDLAMLQNIDSNIAFKKDSDFLNSYKIDFLTYKIPSNDKGVVYNYFYPPSFFNTVSAADILMHKVKKEQIMGKFVLIGTTATGLSDHYKTLEGEDSYGIFAHSSFLENIALNRLLYTPDIFENIAFSISFLCMIFIIFLIVKSRYLCANLFFISSIIMSIAITYICASYNLFLPIGHFITPLIISYMIMLFVLSFVLQIEEKYLALKDLKIRSSITNNMMTMVETRDNETGKHIVRTKEFAKILAQDLAKSDKYKEILTPEIIEQIFQATPLHDIGKIGIADDILKKPYILTEEEMEKMKKHTTIGYKILLESIKNIGDKEDIFLKTAANIAYTHHEKFDGSGYPRGLKGENIPIEGRIVALADVYDALTNKRYYKEAYSFKKAEGIIFSSSATHFDPMIVESFTRLKEIFRKIATENSD